MKKIKINYFEEFIKMTEIIEESTNIFIELMENYSTKNLEKVNENIHKLENDSDHIVHNVRNYLISDFLPPIDREDIGLLLHKLDNVEDGLDEITKNFYILNITEMKEKPLKEYIELLKEASKMIKKVFENLSNPKDKGKLLESIIHINEIEDKADKVYEKYIRKLYEKETNSIEVIKWTTIYNGFEYLFDNYETVADCIEDIIIKTL